MQAIAHTDHRLDNDVLRRNVLKLFGKNVALQNRSALRVDV